MSKRISHSTSLTRERQEFAPLLTRLSDARRRGFIALIYGGHLIDGTPETVWYSTHLDPDDTLKAGAQINISVIPETVHLTLGPTAPTGHQWSAVLVDAETRMVLSVVWTNSDNIKIGPGDSLDLHFDLHFAPRRSRPPP